MADNVAGQVFFKAAEDVVVVGNAFYPKLIFKQERTTKNRTSSVAKTLTEFNTQTLQVGTLFDFIVVEPLAAGWGTAGNTKMLVKTSDFLVPSDLQAFNIVYDGVCIWRI